MPLGAIWFVKLDGDDEVESELTTLGADGLTMAGASELTIGTGDDAASTTDVVGSPQRAPRPLKVITASKARTARWCVTRINNLSGRCEMVRTRSAGYRPGREPSIPAGSRGPAPDTPPQTHIPITANCTHATAPARSLVVARLVRSERAQPGSAELDVAYPPLQ